MQTQKRVTVVLHHHRFGEDVEIFALKAAAAKRVAEIEAAIAAGDDAEEWVERFDAPIR